MRRLVYAFCFEKKFVKTAEFHQASAHLSSVKLPEDILSKAR